MQKKTSPTKLSSSPLNQCTNARGEEWLCIRNIIRALPPQFLPNYTSASATVKMLRKGQDCFNLGILSESNLTLSSQHLSDFWLALLHCVGFRHSRFMVSRPETRAIPSSFFNNFNHKMTSLVNHILPKSVYFMITEIVFTTQKETIDNNRTELS